METETFELVLEKIEAFDEEYGHQSAKFQEGYKGRIPRH